MGLFSRFQTYVDQRNYERDVLRRQQSRPYGDMFAQTMAYHRRGNGAARVVGQEMEQTRAAALLRDRLHEAFMSHPAATEADFERCYPVLRDEVFRQHTMEMLRQNAESLLDV